LANDFQRSFCNNAAIEVFFVFAVFLQLFDAFVNDVDTDFGICQVDFRVGQDIHPFGEGIFHQRAGVDDRIVESIEVFG